MSAWGTLRCAACVAALAFGVPGLASEALGGELTVTNGVEGKARVGVTTWRDMPFKTIVRQQYDYSCGSAAVATLLTYHFNRPTTEQEAFTAMYEIGDKEKINREGFSLYEMKLYLESIGYRADGFRVSLDRLQRIGVPVIVLITWKDYKHFVVIKGVRADHVLVGDSVRGLKVVPRDEFMEQWTDGIVFAIHNADFIAKLHFNDEDEWKGRPEAPLATAVDRSGLSTFNTLLPGAAELF